MPTRRSLQAARQRKKVLDTSGSPAPATSLRSHPSNSPALDFPSSPTPVQPPSDDEDIPRSIPLPTRETRSNKRRSEVFSDVSDTDLAAPPKKTSKKKPGPKPKAKTVKPSSDLDSSEPVVTPKPAKKKPGPKPKPKAKAVPKAKNPRNDVESDAEDLEIVPPTVAPKIVFMIPEASTEGNQRVSIKSSTSFDDAIELMHETIGCVGVERKPTLAYKFSTANKGASSINLRTVDDWDGLVTDVVAKMKNKKDISINISVLPENYMISLRAKNKKKAPAAKGKNKAKLTVMDLDHNESVGEDDDDEDVEAGEKKALSELEAEYRKCGGGQRPSP